MQTIETVTAGPWNLLFLLAVTVGFTLAWRHGTRMSAPREEWLAVLALAAAAGMVGGRLLHAGAPATAAAEAVPGALVLASLAVYYGARFLRIDARAIDGLALAVPIGYAIGRLGAPTRLSEATMALLVAVSVPYLRRTVRRPGSLLLAVLILLGTGGLVLESLHAPASRVVLGLTLVQCVLVALLISACVLLSRRERRATTYPMFRHTGPTTRLLVVASGAPLLLIVAGGLLTPMERVALLCACVPMAVLLVLRVARMSFAHGVTAGVLQAASRR